MQMPGPMPPEAGSPSGGGNGTVDAQIVRSTELWMRAYPCRWREARGEELLGLVVDLAGPDARGLGARAAFDLVRGGWATRWREHPPLHTWLLYRFERRIPVAYRSWALDDINGFWYPIRRSLPGLAVMTIMPLVYRVPGSGISAPYFLMLAVMALSWLFMWPEGNRGRARLRHASPRPGERLVEGTPVPCVVPRERVSARSALTWAALLFGIAAASAVVSALFASKVLQFWMLIPVPMIGFFSVESVDARAGGRRFVAVAILLVALAVGVVAAGVVRRRLGRLLGEAPDQPYRVLRPIRTSGKVNVLFWAVVFAALVWIEVSGLLVLRLSIVLGPVALLLLLPGALVALVVTGRSDAPELAAHDVWWIATRGRLPGVDQPDRALRPFTNLADDAPDRLKGDSPA